MSPRTPSRAPAVGSGAAWMPAFPAVSVAGERLEHLLAEAERLLPEGLRAEEEAVHDLRVCLRRIRVLCRELAAGSAREPAGALQELRAGATGLFRALGGIRDLDILPRELEGLGGAGMLEPAIDPTLADWLELERRRLRAGLSDAAAFFQSELRRFGDRGLPAGLELRRGAGPSARAALRRRARRFREQVARAQESSSDEELHRLRIHGKKLRYAAEAYFGREAFAGSELESGLKTLQDALGEIQDASMVTARLDALAAGGAVSPSAAGPARVAVAGERDRRKARFLEDLRAGAYANLLHEVRNVAAKQGDRGDGGAPDAGRIPLEEIPGIGRAKARRLAEAGLADTEALKAASLEELAAVKTIGPHQARLIKQFVEDGPEGSAALEEPDLEGKRFERVQSVLALGATVSDYARTLAEELSRHEEGDSVRAGRQAERLVDSLADLAQSVDRVPTKKLKGVRGELREAEGLLAKVLELDPASLKMNKLRKALKAHRKAIEAYLA